MAEQQLSGENHRGGVETSSEQMTREFAILQKALGALQLEVAELKKPVPQKALEAAQRSYQKKVEQLQKVQAKMLFLNDKIETNKRKVEARIGNSVNNGLQIAGNFIENDVKQTLQNLRLARQKAVSAGKNMIAADRYAGQKVDQAAEFLVQTYYGNFVSKPARGIENLVKKGSNLADSVSQNLVKNINEEIENRPISTSTLKIIRLLDSRIDDSIKTPADYRKLANADGFISKIEIKVIEELNKVNTKKSDEIKANSIKFASGFVQGASDVLNADIGQIAKNKLKNLFSKKKNNSQSPTN